MPVDDERLTRLASVLSAQRRPSAEWQCLVLDPARDEDFQALERLSAFGSLTVHDTIKEQVAELIASREPRRTYSEPELAEHARLRLGAQGGLRYGRWVYYPWEHCLVHVLPPDEFRELRSDRNRNKITSEEQAVLARKRIGIAGLSVGHAAACALALEGVATHFRLADLDTLSLSNLNRLQQGVRHLAENKAVLAARDLLAIDPYLHIEVFTAGVTEQNLDEFLVGGARLDLLVEECDDLYMKVRLRERARELGMPVIMDTSDRGLLDVERFDLEPSRQLFHGLISQLRAEPLRKLTTKEKIPFVLRVLGGSAMSTDMAASLVEVKESLNSWPQLASAVIAGGAVVAHVARRILLGSFTQSGRFYVDLDDAIRPERAVSNTLSGPLDLEVCGSALQTPKLPRPKLETTQPLSDDFVAFLVGRAVLAPSGGNAQPWRFERRGRRLLCFLDRERSASFLNVDDLASYLAIGAAAENVVLSAAELGCATTVELFPGTANDAVCAFDFTHTPTRASAPLAAHIEARVTNRQLADPRALSSAECLAMTQAAQGCRLQIATGKHELTRLGEILGAADRLRFLSKPLHSDLVREVRWTTREVEETRDGLDPATLEFSASDLAVMRMLAAWPTMERVARLGGGSALKRSAAQSLAGCSGMMQLSMRGSRAEDYLLGGRVLQRVWLTATALGLGVQPFGALLFLGVRVRGTAPSGLDSGIEQQVRRLTQELGQVFPTEPDEVGIMLLRIVHAPPPRARALRRPLHAVLSFQP